MRKILLILLLLLLVPGVVWGQAKVGTAGAQFLKIGVSGRATGLGESFLGIADDASAIYYNPAGLTQLLGREALFTHIQYPAEIRYDFGGIVYPMRGIGGMLGISFYMLGMDDMPVTDYSHQGEEGYFASGETFTVRDYAGGISYAKNLTDRFSLGITLKYIVELYEEERASGWGADVGTLYQTGFRGLKIGMVISNFGPDLKFLSQEYPLPMSFKFGGSMDLLSRGEHKATLSLEGSHPNDNLERYSAGVEYWYKGMFAIRAGEEFNVDTGGFSMGGGLKLGIGGMKLKIDYGYHDFGYLNTTHKFSLGLAF
jgi:hypothetical protein